MQDEIEVKFISVDVEDIRSRLRALGATLEKPMRLMRRVTFDNDFMQDGKDGFLRVRDEGDKVTMTYKQFDSESLSGTKEIETIVGDFDATVGILNSAGVIGSSNQESRRESWQLDGVEVVIDEWPWIEPYIEVEGPDEDSVTKLAELLGFEMEDGLYGGVDVVYKKQYPNMSVRGVIDIKEARFGDPVPGEFLG